MKATTELDKNGYIKYNLSEKDDIYIRVESPDTLFDDTAPVLRKVVPDEFVAFDNSMVKVEHDVVEVESDPIDSTLAEPASMFKNAGKREVLQYDEVNAIIYKEPQSNACDLNDALGVEGDINGDLGVAENLINKPVVEGAALTDSSAVEFTDAYSMSDCTDFSEIGDVDTPVDAPVFSQEGCSDDMFEEVPAVEGAVSFSDSEEELSPGELAIEAELDEEEAIEADLTETAESEYTYEAAESDVADAPVFESPMEEDVEIAAEPEVIEAPVEPNFIDISMIESPMEEDVEIAAEPEVIGASEEAIIDEDIIAIPVDFDDEFDETDEIMAIPVDFEDESVSESSIQAIPIEFEEYDAEAATESEVIEAPVEPNFIDISMIESPMEEDVEIAAEPEVIEIAAEPEVIEAPVEPNFIDISMIESPMEEDVEIAAEPEVIEAPVEPNFIDISMIESPMEEDVEIAAEPEVIEVAAEPEVIEVAAEPEVIEVPSDSSSHVTMDEVGTESGIIATKIVNMEPAMTSAEAVAEPAASKMSFDYDDYDDFLPPTREPERREPGARFRSELMAASEAETIMIIGGSAPVVIVDTSESSVTSAPVVVDDAVSGVMKLTVPGLVDDEESMRFHEPEDIRETEPEQIPVEPCPVHESTVSFTFSRGMESRPSRTGIRFLMGRL